MDPLSLTASIIAIIGVGGQVAKAVRKAASLQGAPDLVLALNNEMADLNLVVVAVQGIFQRLQTTGVRSGELNADNSITSSLKQVKGKVIELAALQKRLNISISGSNVEFDKVAWLREQKKVKRMQEDLKSVRLKLAAALGVLTSSVLIRLETDIGILHTRLSSIERNQQQNGIVQNQTAIDQESAFQNLDSQIKHLHMLQRQIETTQSQRLIQQEATMQEAMTHIHTSQQRIELKLDTHEVTRIARIVESKVQARKQFSADVGTSHKVNQGGVQISTSSSLWDCERNCVCVCHHRQTWKTPRFLHRFLGILFVGYAGVPYLTQKCDSQECIQRSSPMTSITYFFPSWFLASVFVVAVRSSINGLEFNIRVPHIVSDSAIVFDLCAQGDVEGVKTMFRQGLSSPFDIDSTQRTLLDTAIQYMHIELCEILLHAGADPYIENNKGRSPIDSAWLVILSNQGDISSLDRLRALFPGEEHVEKLNFSLLHKAVLGLNPLPLDALLASIDISTINASDSWGRTALWWAARRADYTAILSLIGSGADLNIKSAGGWSPLVSAIFTRDQSCVRLLLERSANVNERDGYGWLPLHLCSVIGCDLDILEMILTRTNINSTTSSEKCTALMLAVQENQVEICDYFISHHDIDLNVVNIDGESALSYAIRSNSHKPLESLLQNQVHLHLKTDAGENLLHYAAQFGDMKCLEILHAFDLGMINAEERTNSISPRQIMKNLKGLTALQIAEQRLDVSPDWLDMFRKLVRGVKNNNAEEYHDALERQG